MNLHMDGIKEKAESQGFNLNQCSNEVLLTEMRDKRVL